VMSVSRLAEGARSPATTGSPGSVPFPHLERGNRHSEKWKLRAPRWRARLVQKNFQKKPCAFSDTLRVTPWENRPNAALAPCKGAGHSWDRTPSVAEALSDGIRWALPLGLRLPPPLQGGLRLRLGVPRAALVPRWPWADLPARRWRAKAPNPIAGACSRFRARQNVRQRRRAGRTPKASPRWRTETCDGLVRKLRQGGKSRE